ncbi:MAG: VPLPA-CTERM sorting domain-containing protein [Pseudomonadota bacterium]
MNYFALLGAITSMFVGAAEVEAASVRYTDGLAVGIDELDVNGAIWYVTFNSGSYNDVYTSGSPIFLNNVAGAEAAVIEIRDVLNLETDVPQIGNANPAEVVWVPFAEENPNSFRARQVGHNEPALPYQLFPSFLGGRDTDYTMQATPRDWLFATFSRTPPPAVPLPASLPLLAGGLCILALRRRTK